MQDSNLESEESPFKPPPALPASSILGVLPLVLIGFATLFVRRMAADLDFALANILTAGLLALAWLYFVALMFFWKHRWVALAAFALPFLAGGLVLSFYRVERLDGALVPQLVARWQAGPELPQAVESTAVESEADTFFVATERDFPQYLGPGRDGRIDLELDPNWDENPPEIVWKQPIGDGWSGFAIQGNAAVTLEQRDAQEWVSAYSLVDGTLLWQHTIEARHTNVAGGTGPRSTPTIVSDRVIACSAVSQVVCLDLRTGAEIWTKDLLGLVDLTQSEFEESVTWGRAGSALVVNDLVIVPFGGAKGASQPLLALDFETGEERWRGGEGQISYSSPVLLKLDGVEQIAFISEGKFAGYDLESGAELWSTEWPGNANSNPACAQPVLVGESRVLLGKGYGEGARLLDIRKKDDQWTVEVVWKKNRVLKTKFTTAVVLGDYAYGLSDGVLECVEIATGEQQWKRGRYRHGQLLLVGTDLLISSEAGELVLVPANPGAFEERYKIPVITDVSWNTLALAGNRLLMRNSDEVACVVLPTLDAVGKSEEPGMSQELTE